MLRRFLLLVGLLPVFASAQLTPQERKGILDALYVGNLTERDLQYERKPYDDKYRLPLVNLAMDKPLDALDTIMRLHSRADGTAADVLYLASRECLSDPELGPRPPLNVRTSPQNALPEPLRGPVMDLVADIEDANVGLKAAISKLSPDERRELIESLPQWATEEPSIKFDFVKRQQIPQARILALIDKVDLRQIRIAGVRLARRIQDELPRLRSVAARVDVKGTLRMVIDGLVVEVSGKGNDVHTANDVNLCIDLGGNDTYTGRYGAGVGYTSVLLDLGGNDTYATPDISMGAGLLGIGIAEDLGGNDTYRCGSISLGCGLAGVGMMADESGDDDYHGVALTQGYGQFGIGLLWDARGNDTYQAAFDAQGAARTGGVGWLVDQAGDDTYRAGGMILNSPLFKDVHYSNAQGFSSGYREDTGGLSGGVGLLTDLGGDDAYLGETYCQAASYWFGLGSLYDASGNDTYSAYHYAQASAMHMTAAYLIDLAGDDSYSVKYGACHAIGHDYGVAVLFDRAGNDVYAARDSRPGVGNANGLGLFIDCAGEDRYFGPPGAGNPARGTGSLGIFVDLDGQDKFADGLDNDQAAVNENWRIAYDVRTPTAVEAPIVPPSEASGPKPGSLSMPSDAEMERIYQKATQWGVGTAQQEVKENVARLAGIGKPALQWMLDKKMRTASHLEERAYVGVVEALGADGREILAQKMLTSTNDDELRMALLIALDTHAAEVAPTLPKLLKIPALQRSAARAAGALKAEQAVNDLMALAASEDRLLALSAMVSLSQIGDPATVPTAQVFLKSGELPMRKAALSLVAQFPDQAMQIAKGLLGDPDEHNVRTGIELLGLVGNQDALSLAAGYLSGPTPGLKIQAMLALDGRCPAEYRPRLAELRKDVDLRVAAVAARIDPGR